jgi:hypothetical protein
MAKWKCIAIKKRNHTHLEAAARANGRGVPVCPMQGKRRKKGAAK